MDKPRADERVEYVDPNEDKSKQLVDLGTGGACCVYTKRLDKGTPVRMSLDSLTVDAKVTYCTKRTDGYRLGLQFWGLTDAQKKELKTLTDRFSCGVPVSCSVKEQSTDSGKSA